MRIHCNLFGCHRSLGYPRCTRCWIGFAAVGFIERGWLPWLWGVPGTVWRGVWNRKCESCGKRFRRSRGYADGCSLYEIP
jgi:hypothetical protein